MHRQADLGACVASVQMESGKLITVIKGLKAKQFRVTEYYRLRGTLVGFFPTYSSSILKNGKKRPFISFSGILQAALFLGVFSYCGLI